MRRARNGGGRARDAPRRGCGPLRLPVADARGHVHPSRRWRRGGIRPPRGPAGVRPSARSGRIPAFHLLSGSRGAPAGARPHGHGRIHDPQRPAAGRRALRHRLPPPLDLVRHRLCRPDSVVARQAAHRAVHVRDVRDRVRPARIRALVEPRGGGRGGHTEPRQRRARRHPGGGGRCREGLSPEGPAVLGGTRRRRGAGRPPSRLLPRQAWYAYAPRVHRRRALGDAAGIRGGARRSQHWPAAAGAGLRGGRAGRVAAAGVPRAAPPGEPGCRCGRGVCRVAGVRRGDGDQREPRRDARSEPVRHVVHPAGDSAVPGDRSRGGPPRHLDGAARCRLCRTWRVGLSPGARGSRRSADAPRVVPVDQTSVDRQSAAGDLRGAPARPRRELAAGRHTRMREDPAAGPGRA